MKQNLCINREKQPKRVNPKIKTSHMLINYSTQTAQI